ncbi:MAG: DUF4139 domain-containing protein [Bacteroidota bacterium]
MSPVKTIISCLLLLHGITTKSQDFKTESVSIFKNGQSFFIKSGNVETENGIFKISEDQAPASLFGTLWFNAPANEILSIKSYPDSVEETSIKTAQLLHEMLFFNKGRQLKVYLNDDTSIQGTVEDITDKQPPNGVIAPQQKNLITMKKSGGGWTSFYVGQVRQVDFLEKPTIQAEQINKLQKNIIEIIFNEKNPNQPLDMMYLRNGFAWAPEYLLSLKSDKKADLTLQAEITNNGEDLNDIKLNLVVGVPNFKFADRLAFLVDFVKQMNFGSVPINTQFLSNTITTQRNAYSTDAPIESPITPIEGQGNEDFFFYGVNNFSLPKGGRAMQRIFEEEIEIAHVYEANLPGNNNVRSFGDDFFFSPDNQHKVFHTIRVNNETGQPWTTGSVLIMNEEGEKRPVSQDMLTYTSNGGHSFIKVTESTDIKIKHAEKEISREQNARRFPKNSHYYDLVKVEGKIKIRNFKNEAIDLNLRRTILGELEKTNLPWLTQGTVNFNGTPNKANNVCWEINLKAGEEREVVYAYEVYVRS